MYSCIVTLLAENRFTVRRFVTSFFFSFFFAVSLILLFGEVKKIYIINIIKLLQVQFTSVAFVFIP